MRREAKEEEGGARVLEVENGGQADKGEGMIVVIIIVIGYI